MSVPGPYGKRVSVRIRGSVCLVHMVRVSVSDNFSVRVRI